MKESKQTLKWTKNINVYEREIPLITIEETKRISFYTEKKRTITSDHHGQWRQVITLKAISGLHTLVVLSSAVYQEDMPRNQLGRNKT